MSRRRPAAPTRPTGGSEQSNAKLARRSSREVKAPPGWVPRIVDDASLTQLLERLPSDPGVYIMRDHAGEVIYVGKAKVLRNRVRQYFNGTDTRLFVPLLGKLVGDIETVVVANVKEALLLENNLIKEHRPRFNVKLRDDSNYLVLKLDPREKWPRLELVRHVGHDGAWYFGPYHSARSARATLRAVNRHFQLRTCTDFVLTHRARPCLQHQIGRCPAPCVYDVDKNAYADQVSDVRLFLSGRHRELVAGLQLRMEQAAGELEFETAARLRDQLTAIDTALQSQQVVGTTDVDQDAFGMYREGGQVELVVLHVREGKLQQTQSWSQKGMELPDADVLSSFLSAYYDKAAFVPDEVLLPYPLHEDDEGALAEWLRDRKGRKVVIATPERGDRKKLVTLACKNAASSFTTRRDRREDSELAMGRLQTRLGLSKLPRVIECYDISHIQGSDAVASLVVFVDGIATKTRYRSFKIRGVRTDDDEATLAQGYVQNDDFASMYEVLGRRFRRALASLERDAEDEGEGEGDPPQGTEEDDPWALPDLVVIDGGKGQLARVLAALGDLGIPIGAEGIDVVALAKERKNGLGRGRAAMAQLKARRKPGDDSPSSTDTASSRGSDATEDAIIAPGDVPAGDDGETRGDGTTSPAADAGPASTPGAAWVEYVVEQASADAARAVDTDTFEVRPERVFVPGVKEPIVLKPGSSERFLMERVRDEAHRFAITLHRKRRGKRSLHSALDEIEGVGAVTKRALVKHFGSIAAIRQASVEQLCEVKGVGQALAGRIRDTIGRGDDGDG